jgi:hypothetical protein
MADKMPPDQPIEIIPGKDLPVRSKKEWSGDDPEESGHIFIGTDMVTDNYVSSLLYKIFRPLHNQFLPKKKKIADAGYTR